MSERIVVANSLPFTGKDLNPFVSMGNVLAFDARDWASNRGDAWLWGIIFGWSKESLQELGERHRWDERQIKRLRLLHLAYRRAEVHAQHAESNGCF